MITLIVIFSILTPLSLIAASYSACKEVSRYHNKWNELYIPIATLNVCLSLLSFFLPFTCIKIMEASVKADVINQKFKTSYTAMEVFFAESVIDEIKEIDRNRNEHRIELKK